MPTTRPGTEELRSYWPEVKRVFHAALERSKEEREAFLTEVCSGDPRLRAEVESLLAVHEEEDPFLEESALTAAAGTMDDAAAGRRIGPYRLIREIGRGGMGTVFLAVREDEIRKTVAVKLISRGMDTDAVIRRFRHERQVLAELDHPFIARLLDAGATDDGLPYFVMEYVEGEPLNRYCEAHHLSIDERLELFQSVCEAVQYAHSHLIVHRDLKPGNIFVTSEGIPKLLDFGLAKVLDPGAGAARTALTVGPLRAMTPEYASPEQVRGDAITTASDVYSLGVVLHELLSARHPYPLETTNPSEVERVVCEQEPPRPSDVATDERRARRLRGDLDNIVGKALRKEPDRRYATVEQLSDDVARHRDGRTVSARPDTVLYRCSRFMKRNRIPVAAAAVAVMALLAGMATTTWQARVARAERARAEQRFEELHRLAGLLIFDYNEAIAALPGSTPIRERMVSDAFEYLDLLAREAGDDPVLRTELADGYVKMGHIQARMGDNAGALASYRRALDLYGSLPAARPEDVGLQRRLAYGHVLLADRLTDAGDAASALEEHRQAFALRERILGAHADEPQSTTDFLESVFYMGRALQSVGRYDEGLAHFRRLARSADSITAASPDDAELQLHRHTAHHTLAGGLATAGDLAGAAREYRVALEIGRGLITREPANAHYRQAFSRTSLRLGRTLGELGDHDGALGAIAAARETSERLARQDPSNNETENDLVLIHAAAGEELAALGRTREALASYERSREIGEGAVRRTTSYARVRRGLAETYRGLGELRARTGDAAGGVALLRRAVATFDSLVAGDPANAGLRHEAALAYQRLGNALEVEAGSRESCAVYERSAEMWRALEEAGTLTPTGARHPAEVARALAVCR